MSPRPPLTYVYAVLEAQQVGAFSTEPIAGIGGAAVRPLLEDGLAAAISDASPDEFQEQSLNERVRDLSWLAPRALAHQEVNARLFERTDALLPLSFGTIFLGEERVREFLRREQAALRERLGRVRQRSEWVVSIRRADAEARAALERWSQPLQQARDEVARATPGRAYLLRRRLDDLLRDELARFDADAVGTIVSRTAAVAEEVRREPLSESATAADGATLARASLLVRRSEEGRLVDVFETARQEWQPRGYDSALSGPWPPYRFAGVEDPASAAVAASG